MYWIDCCHLGTITNDPIFQNVIPYGVLGYCFAAQVFLTSYSSTTDSSAPLFPCDDIGIMQDPLPIIRLVD